MNQKEFRDRVITAVVDDLKRNGLIRQAIKIDVSHNPAMGISEKTGTKQEYEYLNIDINHNGDDGGYSWTIHARGRAGKHDPVKAMEQAGQKALKALLAVSIDKYELDNGEPEEVLENENPCTPDTSPKKKVMFTLGVDGGEEFSEWIEELRNILSRFSDLLQERPRLEINATTGKHLTN